MDPPPLPQSNGVSEGQDAPVAPTKARTESFSARSDDSQTAADFIRDQEQLEADAREALPYSIENCTKPLGPLRQSVFSCLTCNPPPANVSDTYEAAGVCYSCSVQCHGEHTLVEIFTKRNFTCDCGTTRFPATSPCALRINETTKTKGGVHSEEPDVNNKYNQNFRNRFCGCECDYDPFQQKGTMFQCLGLGTHETGGCGEDWWHPGCLVGLGPKWFEKLPKPEKEPQPKQETPDASLATIAEEPASEAETNGDHAIDEEDDEDLPPPPGFPADDEFEAFLCYKCVDAHPWIKRYAGTDGFLAPVYLKKDEEATIAPTGDADASKKRKASDEDDEVDSQSSKRQKAELETDEASTAAETPQTQTEPLVSTSAPESSTCKSSLLPAAPQGQFSLFLKEDFRDKICHCASCFPLLVPHPQLLEEEETYEPPVSEDGASDHGGSTHGSGSLLDRGESALRNVDRVRAIEGVMAYNHLKDKLTPFFKQFAESGQTISAEDIKEYFAKLRGDESAIKEAGEAAKDGDHRQEQSGY
ncbi:protein mlo2 [Rhypophila decipiens]|uniref:Protein mlo2 n=1 Tax=Rhypophila decipiens TaxID=261697 RepID=A0AAN6Y7T8_9PEZI|nr:protein mlo2 [Rhypophila decipiens]